MSLVDRGNAIRMEMRQPAAQRSTASCRSYNQRPTDNIESAQVEVMMNLIQTSQVCL